MEERIIELINKYNHDITNTIIDLVSIPTSNPLGKNYEKCVHYISGLLENWKIEHRIITIPFKDYDRFSVIGSIGGGDKGLHLHGHYDVVPPDSQDQFRPAIEKNLIYGRGSSDMKSGIASILFALIALKESGINLNGKITFSFVPDEETGGRMGTRYLFESGILPHDNLVGMLMPEPTSGVIWNASRGALTYRIQLKGKSAHVALANQGDNAFEHMVYVANSIIGLKKKINSVLLVGGESRSGINFNVVPDKAHFTLDGRFDSDTEIEKMKQEVASIIDGYRTKGMEIEVEVIQEGEPSKSSTKTPVAKILKQTILDIIEKEPVFKTCPGLCETRFFSAIGIPAYAYGPGFLEVSHGPDEYVDMKNVMNCTKIYALTAYRMLT